MNGYIFIAKLMLVCLSFGKRSADDCPEIPLLIELALILRLYTEWFLRAYIIVLTERQNNVA